MIGVNNQMFDPGEGAYFTYVKNPDPRYLAGAPSGLDQNEADDADNIRYTGGTLAANSAFTVISQTQGSNAATMKITAYDIADPPQARDFVSGLGSGSTPTITSVKVNGVAVAFSGNRVIVSGLHAGDQIQAAGSEIMLILHSGRAPRLTSRISRATSLESVHRKQRPKTRAVMEGG